MYRMATWLKTLYTQICNTIAAPIKEAPPLDLIWEWTESITEGAVPYLSHTFSHPFAPSSSSPSTSPHLTKEGAIQCQAGIITRIVSGTDAPPCRLSIIKTLVHPSKVSIGGCLDPDCLLRDCKGNRMELVGGGATAGGGSNSSIITPTSVRIIAPHHKTEALMQNQGPLDITLPPGRPLTDMLVHWIQHGWHCLVSSTHSSTSSLFLSSVGRPFTDTTFWQYWMKLLQDRPVGLSLFPPNLARTSFVEAFTEGGQVCMVHLDVYSLPTGLPLIFMYKYICRI